MEDLISINEEGIDKLVLEIYDYFERINDILNQINDLILDSKSYFISPINSEMIEIYSDMKISIDNFKSNISSYSSDLMKVKNKFRQTAVDLSLEAMKATAKIQSDIK